MGQIKILSFLVTKYKMAARLVLRRRLSYNTKSNGRRVSKTPGGKLVYLYTKKQGTTPKCGDCKCKLRGVKSVRPSKMKNLSKTKKHVSRPYGGSICSGCVKMRVVRAFLIEEQKLVVRVLRAQQGTKGKSA